jgi:hypothetical protein
MLTREDVERIVENVLRELTLEVENGSFYCDPNSRTVTLKLGDRTITSTSFSVEDKPGYDG